MTGMTRDRDQAPLMRDLHEVGLKHGVTLVVVALPIDGHIRQQFGLLIDHKEQTPIEDVYVRWLEAGIYLIQATNAVEEYMLKETKAPAPAESP